MFPSFFAPAGDLFAELDRLSREMQQLFDGMPVNIRAGRRGGFPALNIGHTPSSVEVYAFAPGIDPQRLKVEIHKGVLTIEGERASDLPPSGDKQRVYANERIAGSFKRVIGLPDDVDAAQVDATYRDGLLHVSIKRRADAQPRRIAIN